MPRQTPEQELDAIEALVAQSPGGLGISALEAALTQTAALLNRRTLQRRLQKLIDAGRISTEGKSIALVYRALQPMQTLLAGQQAYKAEPVSGRWRVAEAEPDVDVSAEGAAVRAQVRRPLMHRRPVGYQRAFLEDYQPNATFYLPEALRGQLHMMGRTAAGDRPAGTYARDILSRLLVDLSWASSRLEGNTYSRLDTQNLIERGQVAQGKDAIETQMILNHKAAIEMLVEGVDEVGFDAFTFKNLHAVLSQDLMPNPAASGRLRQCVVDISGTVFAPLAIPQVIEECFASLLDKAAAIADPFEQAFFVMVQLPYLQPFEDVNKRVSRIGANIPLIRHNLCPLSFIDVPERAYIEGLLGVYELGDVALLRDVFVWAYARSCQRYLAITPTMVAPDPLKIRYREALIEAVQQVVKGGLKPAPAVLTAVSQSLAEPQDAALFAQWLAQALEQLHEGSVARYRLRRSEFEAWQQAQA